MKIKVLLVMPERKVQVVKIPRSIKFIKALIGDELLKIRLDNNNILISNKNAEHNEFNRIVGKNIILGTFLVVSVKNRKRVSMKKKDVRKYTNMFKLSKHQKKINIYREEYLEEYYSNQKIMKQKMLKEIKKKSLI